MSSAFWWHKRVFLTGHTGFKGSWLQALSAEVSCNSSASDTAKNIFTQAGMASGAGGLRDLTAPQSAAAEAQYEIILLQSKTSCSTQFLRRSSQYLRHQCDGHGELVRGHSSNTWGYESQALDNVPVGQGTAQYLLPSILG